MSDKEKMVEEKDEKSESSEKKEKVVKPKIPLKTRITNFFKEYKSELKKIVWPTREQVIKNTGIVLTVIVIISVMVGVLDSVFGLGIQALGGIVTK